MPLGLIPIPRTNDAVTQCSISLDIELWALNNVLTKGLFKYRVIRFGPSPDIPPLSPTVDRTILEWELKVEIVEMRYGFLKNLYTSIDLAVLKHLSRF